MRLNVTLVLVLALVLRGILNPLAKRPRWIRLWKISTRINLLEAFILETLLAIIRESAEEEFNRRVRGDLVSTVEQATRTAIKFYANITFIRRRNTGPEELPYTLLDEVLQVLSSRSPEGAQRLRRRVEAER